MLRQIEKLYGLFPPSTVFWISAEAVFGSVLQGWINIRLYLPLEFKSFQSEDDIFSTVSAACRRAWAVHA